MQGRPGECCAGHIRKHCLVREAALPILGTDACGNALRNTLVELPTARRHGQPEHLPPLVTFRLGWTTQRRLEGHL